jgi:hypothetical protein
VERLPAYAPELNPVEGLWSWLKGTDLANLACPTLVEVTESHDASGQHPEPVRNGLRRFPVVTQERAGGWRRPIRTCLAVTCAMIAR